MINSLGAGGTERSTSLMLPLMRERGVEVVVFTLKREQVGDEERVRDAGIQVTVLTARRMVGRVRQLRSELKRLAPDVVHTAIFDADVVGRLAAIRTGIPVVSSLVNTPYDPERLK
ncbi:MAG: glycosyltransferase, partial [Ilumatobacteraceae bacterium]